MPFRPKYQCLKRKWDTCTRNVHKREKRSANKFAEQKKEIDHQKGQMDALSTENAALKRALQREAIRNREKLDVVRQRSKKKRKLLRDKYQKRWHRLCLKNQALVQKCDSSDSSEPEPCCSCEGKEVQIDELKEALDTLALDKIHALDAGSYNYKVRECCMKLLSHNVSI